MRLEQVTVQLRERSGWEAMELGMALVRRDAAAIYRPWAWMSLLVFVVLNGAAWAIDRIWLAALLMWWFKPLFDRIPLYVISRSVFGEVPATAEVMRAQWRWGWPRMWQLLSWRRFSPVRSLYLPVDLLEAPSAGNAARPSGRHAALAGTAYGHASLLTVVCMNFEAVIALGSIALVFMLTPVEYLPETGRAMWALMADRPPWWAQMALNAMLWLATSVIEPFFVGAGFGLYLNRRTRLEAWDVEIVFRGLRKRLIAAATPWLLLLATGVVLSPQAHALPPAGSDAATAAMPAPAPKKAAQPPAATLQQIFGDQQVDPAAFDRAAERAYQDPLLGQARTHRQWQWRHQKEDKAEQKQVPPAWLSRLGGALAFIGEWGLWLVVVVLAIVLLASMRYWLPWMRGGGTRLREQAPAQEQHGQDAPEALPEHVADAARSLWQQGRQRRALALLYRASVQSMSALAQMGLPPGATEAYCLRVSQRVQDASQRQLFARMVRVWQYAAYAQRMPPEDEFQDLVQQLQLSYRWPS